MNETRMLRCIETIRELLCDMNPVEIFDHMHTQYDKNNGIAGFYLDGVWFDIWRNLVETQLDMLEGELSEIREPVADSSKDFSNWSLNDG